MDATCSMAADGVSADASTCPANDSCPLADADPCPSADADAVLPAGCASGEADAVVVRHMRDQDPLQFYTLVKMHLSFLLNLSVDEVDAPALLEDKTNDSARKILPFASKSRGKSSKSSGGGDGIVLSHEGVCQAYQLIEFLSREENLVQEGLFRKTGNLTRQQELRRRLLAGESLDFESGTYTAHDCASVLKAFLASLTEPLLTDSLYAAHCQVSELCPADAPADRSPALAARQLKAQQLLLLLAPAPHRRLLADLLSLLHRVAGHQSSNRMSALSLGTLLAPHLLCPRRMAPAQLQSAADGVARAAALLIERSPLLFQVPEELVIDVRAYLERRTGPGPARRRRRSCSDVESPQASTVYSFVDRERSVAEAERTDTATALAGLYAHVSSMPDSSRRRKLIKQFNRESGVGTPTVTARARTRSFGESLRKHLPFAAGRQRKSVAGGAGPLARRSHSEELLSSPASPATELRAVYRRTADDTVSMWPSPSAEAPPPIKRALLTPTAAKFTPRLARSLRQVQREGVPRGSAAPPLPGTARRSQHTAEMSTFRAGRNNSMRRGQVPLRPAHVSAACSSPHHQHQSPISGQLSSCGSGARLQLLTPRSRRAVCLNSRSALPGAGQHSGQCTGQHSGQCTRQDNGSSVEPAALGSLTSQSKTESLSPVQVRPLDDSPTVGKRARGGIPDLSSGGDSSIGGADLLSSPFRRYLLRRDIVTAELPDPSPVSVAREDLSRMDVARADLSRMDVARADLSRMDVARADLSRMDVARADPSRMDVDSPCPTEVSVDRLLAGERSLTDSLMECLDGAEPAAADTDGAEPASTDTEPAAADTEPAAADTATVDTSSDTEDTDPAAMKSLLSDSAESRIHPSDAGAVWPPQPTDGLVEGSSTTVDGSSSTLSCDVTSPPLPALGSGRHRAPLTDLSNQPVPAAAAGSQSTPPSATSGQSAPPSATSGQSVPPAAASQSAPPAAAASQLVPDICVTDDSAADKDQRAQPTDISCHSLKIPADTLELLNCSAPLCQWADAADAIPAEPSSVGSENQRRKTLTDRETNPMAHRRIGAPRKRRSVMFETDL